MFWQSRSSIEENHTFLVDDQGELTYSHLFRLADDAFGERARGVMAIICDKNIIFNSNTNVSIALRTNDIWPPSTKV